MDDTTPSAVTRRFKVAVWRSVMEVHAAVLRAIEVELEKRHQLSLTEFDTLVNIPAEGARHGELSERVILSQSALSRLLDRLQGRGLVTRRGVPQDSRGVQIQLTDQGKALIRRAARTNADVVEEHFADRMSVEQLQCVFEIFGQLHDRK
jgi:DNA-binding MarR family transcriptional regulator